ncbi:MAG: PH domain-containing protein [Patescibacteria group bacterium]
MHLSHFVRQKSYEHVEHMLRRHPITFIPTVLLFVVLMLVPVAVYIMTDSLFPELLSGSVSFPILVLFGSFYYLSIYLFFYAHFVDYYLDLWIITNDRVIDIDQRGLFNRVITELDLFRIQDVTTVVKGFFPTVFKYGNIILTTASSTNSIIIENVPHPDTVRHELIVLAETDRKYHVGDMKKLNATLDS